MTYIISAKRTALGAFLGQFQRIKATELATHVVKDAYLSLGNKPPLVEALYMGCVLPAGLGQAPARQVALNSGLGNQVDAVTVNKVCGSGMKTIMLCADLIEAGHYDLAVAGGMENMSAAPHLLTASRKGQKLGHLEALDHMVQDGLEDPYSKRSMGSLAEETMQQYGFTREEQDEYAANSVKRAQEATRAGAFKNEITPVPTPDKKGFYEEDEHAMRLNPEKIPTLKPIFAKDGTLTAANSSALADGAAALVLASEKAVKEKSLKPLAKIVAHCTHSQEPKDYSVAPVGALTKLLKKTGWSADEVDLFEVNEAFAGVALAVMREHNIPHEKVNVNGGSCAMGHPLGASGARIVVTLIHALKQRNLKKGMATLCIGGGEATAIAIEIMD